MKIALLSDVHANLPALEAVFAAISALRVTKIYSLGDQVGYGADPGACLDRLDSKRAAMLRGNHDAAVGDSSELERYVEHARIALDWTRVTLLARHRVRLAALPLVRTAGGALLVHASPYEPSEWHYVLSAADARAAFAATKARVCFLGHTHRAGTWSVDAKGSLEWQAGGEVRFRRGRRYLVNVGSVGQPRDGDPQAAFALWDVPRGSVAIHRIAYDVAEAARRIEAAGLPPHLARRLFAGR